MREVKNFNEFHKEIVDKDIIEVLNITKEYRDQSNRKLYLGEIIEKEKPKFKDNNLIISPVGSGKSFLIENKLLYDGFSGKALYLTSNTALKDSICPDDNKLRNKLVNERKSLGFFSSTNREKIGESKYSVHVMTYHEFGSRIESPNQKFTEDIDLVFCDEIHSLPIYKSYDNSAELDRAMRWLFSKHNNKTIFYFTATEDKLMELEKKIPGYLSAVTIFDYSNYPGIRRYIANSTYLINHVEQLRPHFKAKLDSFNYYGYKGLAFTKHISEQERICNIAESEGFKPIALWSINNNEKEMNKEQVAVREFVLNTGYIPEPYNLLVINGSMQEGWNLIDDKMKLAILDTTDVTEQIQSLGRIRKDIDILIKKTKDDLDLKKIVEISDKYIDIPLTRDEKINLYLELNIINEYGEVSKWPTIKKIIKESGYHIEDKYIMKNNKRTRASVISIPIPNSNFKI